ncbi:hypothetical protein K431DRAFT_284333 [Polychaeton citri CBS 116435]|uniref:BHLH domain-containing protein n=1 Tax=Polychaeton citri CBS 116435 TaxID=1314669 RepID=A0A9P4Q7P0_9PEZI|nr:hypothetical protein K431DRAFT_284333 [Polychaeton citri CBS 116435]
MAAVATNKRKRDSQDMQAIRPGPGLSAGDFEGYLQAQHEGMDSGEHSIDFASMLAQHEENGGGSGDSNDHTHVHQPDAPPPPPPQPQQRQEGNGPNASDTASAALAQHYTMTVPQPTEQAFLAQHGESGEPRDSADRGSSGHGRSSFGEFEGGSVKEPQATANGSPGQHSSALLQELNSKDPKPAVGSEEWHKVRRDNHKEVERRRRETINEGINELAKIVPGCEKNKGSILARAVQFITQLKENETQNIEKWTLEKLLTEQAIAELSSSCDKLKAECSRAWSESEKWKVAAMKAGITSIEGDEEGDNDEQGVE